jgi:hypothetical protein
MAAVHETIHTRLFEQPARQTLGPWTRPDQRIWPVYYESSQMLCQMVQTPQHETATPGTNTSWQYYPAGIVHTTIHSRYRKMPLFKIHALRLTLFRSRFSWPTLLRCSIPSLPPETGHDAIRSESCNVRRLRGNFTAGNRTSLLMQRRSNALILPCTNYCNKGTLTYLLQAMAVKG